MKQKSTDYIISFLWALCEAIFLPVVPDVWLSIASTNTLKRGLKNVIFALLGAIIGGSILYWIGRIYPNSAIDQLTILPDVKIEYLDTVKDQLEAIGFKALFKGPIQGIPYKIYATVIGMLGYNYYAFLLISIPARAFRFILSVCLSNLFAQLTKNKLAPVYIKFIILTVWVLIYLKYIEWI